MKRLKREKTCPITGEEVEPQLLGNGLGAGRGRGIGTGNKNPKYLRRGKKQGLLDIETKEGLKKYFLKDYK